MDADGYESLLLCVDDGVATVTCNRPDAHNAISLAMVAEAYDVLEAIAGRPGARVVVLTGAGDRFVNPGAELGRTFFPPSVSAKTSLPWSIACATHYRRRCAP